MTLAADPTAGERSLVDLARALVAELSTIAEQETALARTELGEITRRAKATGRIAGVAGALGVVAVSALTTAAVLALAIVLPGWAAGLIIGVPVALVAAILALRVKREVTSTPPVPERTLASLKENVEWARHQLSAPGHYREPAPETEQGAVRVRMNRIIAAIAARLDIRARATERAFAVIARSRETVRLAKVSAVQIVEISARHRGSNGSITNGRAPGSSSLSRAGRGRELR